MVKGVTKRVVVIKSPDRRIFDEAIFIVREEAASGITSGDILKEAQAVADSYIQANIRGGFFRRIPPLAAALSGAGVAAAVWAVFEFLI